MLKLALYTISGGIGGAAFILIFFVNETSRVRDMPAWGVIILLISSLAGAVFAFGFYYEMHFKKEKISNE